MSAKTMKVANGYSTSLGKADGYKVLVVRNSVVYHPGDILCRAEVKELCDNPSWDITVVPYLEGK